MNNLYVEWEFFRTFCFCGFKQVILRAKKECSILSNL
jgi:hypothetical protein